MNWREIKRQLIHAAFGSILIALVAVLGAKQALPVIVVVFLAGLVVSLALRSGWKIPLLPKMVEAVERDYEKKIPGRGALLFFIGIIIMLAFFDNLQIVLGAMMVAAYGDSVSTIAGKYFGKHRLLFKKTVEGTAAGIAASFLALLLLFPPLVAFEAAAAGMLVELIPVDDNLTVPIGVALALSFLL